MPKNPRLIGEGLYHHIYVWGNDRHPVFKIKSNYEKYLELLETYSYNLNITIIAYALMAWHVHLFVFDKSGSLSHFMRTIHGRYAQYFNKATGRTGHVFGERFNSKIVQVNTYGLLLSRYIHRQPLEAGLVKDPKDFPWTSYRAYLGLEKRSFLEPDVVLNQFGQGEMGFHLYEEFVLGDIENHIESDEKTKKALGDAAFVDEIEKATEKTVFQSKENISDEQLIKTLGERLGCESTILLDPHGLTERRLRHKAFSILVKEYRLPIRRTAYLFNVTPMAVEKVIRDIT